MRQDALFMPKATRPGEVPALLRFLGKLVVEVLPAALASVIGAFLFAHYQFGEPAAAGAAGTAQAALPASAAMLQLVREEHAMVRDLLVAQQAANQRRDAAADAADARAEEDAKLADAAVHRVAGAEIAEKPIGGRAKPKVVAADAAATPAEAQLPTVLVASAAPAPEPEPAFPPAPDPAPAAPASFVSRTLGVPGHVLSATLHAVMTIGSIPSWIGHRVGAMDPEIRLPSASAAW